MKSKQISFFLQERIDAGDFPSAVYLVAEKGEIVFQDALGLAVVEPERIEAKIDTIYDLASLTKVLVTGLLTAIHIDRGVLQLSSNLGDLLTNFRDSRISHLTIEQLATHASGMAAWVPIYLLTESPRHLESVLERQMVFNAGEKVKYSDLNFIALGLVLSEAVDTGHYPTLDAKYFRLVIERLGLWRTAFNPLTGGGIFDRDEFAASEKGNEYERQTCIELGYLEPPKGGAPNFFRDYQIWGDVHDGNAWFMDGVAGHAGLFSTAEEVFKIALQFLPNYTSLLKPETCELFRTNFTKGMNEDRSFAFQLASSEGSTAGALMSRESFGHNGFTGTSLWIDPVKERIFVLLTNRTHAHPLPFVNINSVRRRFHDMAVALLDEKN